MKVKKLKINPSRISATGAHRALAYSATPIEVSQELVDNSIEHNSTQIQVTLDEHSNCYIVEDDGEDGIPTDVFLERYHTMYAEAGPRTGLGFFGVGSMAFKSVGDTRITITKNHDGILYSIWDTSKNINDIEVDWLDKTKPLPQKLKEYTRPIKRFAFNEEGNGTMVILPKRQLQWDQYDTPLGLVVPLGISFRARYGYRLHRDGNMDKIVIRIRTKSDRQFTYPVLKKNILPDQYNEVKRNGISVCTWWEKKPSAGKRMAEIYYDGIMTGGTSFVKKGTRKKFVATSAAECNNIRQVIFCDSTCAHLLKMNPIKTGFDIEKDWVNAMRANAFSLVFDRQTALKEEEREKVKQEVRDIPSFYKDIDPPLFKAIKENDGRYLGDFIMRLVEDIKDPKTSNIPIDRKLTRASKIATQNNGDSNE